MKLLFVCTHNACRSVLGEVTARALGATAASAGSHPAGRIHPRTLEYLQSRDIETADLTSQGLEDFEHFDPDLVITVCDNAANEPCPLWMGEAPSAHWGLPDPSKVETGVDAAFETVHGLLRARLEKLLAETARGKALAEAAERIAREVPAHE